MLVGSRHKKNTSLSKYLTIPSRLNETVISADRNVNRFSKKFLIEKEKEIEDKNKEIEEISKMYEDKIHELNKSRNDERSKFEQKLKGFSTTLKSLTNKKKLKYSTNRANTPVTNIDFFLPNKTQTGRLDKIDDDSDEIDDDEEPKSKLFAKIDEMAGRYESLRKSIASTINENNRDSMTVHNMVNTVFDDEVNHYYPTTKSTCSNDFSDIDFLMSPKGRNNKHYNF